MIEIISNVYVFCFGLIIGSFLNALIWRLHTEESMMKRSKCPKCQHELSWFENIPVLSYVFLQGRCRHCHESISIQYPLVEFITGLLFLLAFVNAKIEIANANIFDLFLVFKSWFIISVMIIVFIYDLRWYLILDKVMLPTGIALFVMWFFENWSLGYLSSFNNTWLSLLFSMLIGGGFFGLQYVLSRGKWIGFGDVKFGLIMGLALGVSKVIGAIFLAYILGAVIGIFLISLGKKEMGSKLPFGTFLSVATIVMLLWGEGVISWYMKILGY